MKYRIETMASNQLSNGNAKANALRLVEKQRKMFTMWLDYFKSKNMLKSREYTSYLQAINEIYGPHLTHYKNTESKSHDILNHLHNKIEEFQAEIKAFQAKQALSKLSNENSVLKFDGGRTKKTRRAKKSKRSKTRR